MAIPVLSDMIFSGGAGISGLPNAAAATEPVTLQQLQTQVGGLAFKDDARVKTTGNINLASPGATIDSVTMANGDRVLVGSQTAAAENGIYIWTGAAIALTRSTDADTFDDLEGAVISITEGTLGAPSGNPTRWKQTAVNGTLGTTPINWISDQTSVPSATEAVAGILEIATQSETDTGTADNLAITPLKLATSSRSQRTIPQTIGDGTATTYSVTHSFNTFDVDAVVKEATGARRNTIVEWDTPDVNTVRVLFKTAPASNSYRVIVERL